MNVHKNINVLPLTKDVTTIFLCERGCGADPEGVHNLCLVFKIYVKQIMSKSPSRLSSWFTATTKTSK